MDPIEDAAAEADPARVVEMGMGSNGPLVDRAYSEALPYQYVREVVKNGIEAGATHMELGVDWVQVAASQGSVYRLQYRDNGCGMSDEELEAYFNHISAGSKVLNAQGNYGVGAKISLLPWNHKGVIVMSWQDGDGSMIRLRKASNRNYGLQKWAVPTEDHEGNAEVDEHGNPLYTWHKVIDAYEEYAPEWVRPSSSSPGSGTVIICLGNTGVEDTILGPDGKGTVKQHTLALNTRFFEIPSHVTVVCQELANNRKKDWPLTPTSLNASNPNGINNRTIRGAKYFLDRFTRPENHGTVNLTGAKAHWWLMEDEEVAESSGRRVVRHNINSFAMHNGFIGALYDNELYDVATGTAEARQRYHAFGVIREPVWSKLTIVIEPDRRDEVAGTVGVFPNGARSHLYYSGSVNGELPWTAWGLEFMGDLPQSIKSAIDKAAVANQKVDLTEKLKALLPRMRQRFYRPSAQGPELVLLNRTGGVAKRMKRKKSTPTPRPGGGPQGGVAGRNVAGAPNPSGHTRASEFNPKVDVPSIEWVRERDMSHPNRAAEYVRNAHKILVNADFWLFKQEFEHWASIYQAVQGAQRHIHDVIQEVYGLALGSRVMHAWTLEGKPGWEDEDDFDKLVSPESLTLACLGIAHADAQIAPKIGGRLGAAARGRKQSAG